MLMASTVFLLLIAITLIFFGVRGLLPYLRSRSWKSIDARVVAISERVKEVWLSESVKIGYSFPELKYEYCVGNKKYLADRVAFQLRDIWVPEVNEWGDKTAAGDRFWAKWKVNTIIRIFIDPRKPWSAVIVRDMDGRRFSHYMALIGSGVLCLVVVAAINLAVAAQ